MASTCAIQLLIQQLLRLLHLLKFKNHHSPKFPPAKEFSILRYDIQQAFTEVEMTSDCKMFFLNFSSRPLSSPCRKTISTCTTLSWENNPNNFSSCMFTAFPPSLTHAQAHKGEGISLTYYHFHQSNFHNFKIDYEITFNKKRTPPKFPPAKEDKGVKKRGCLGHFLAFVFWSAQLIASGISLFFWLLF
ncbi:MAG: hypothetical protein ACK5JC_04835 [Bacteroidota bacterium]